MYDYRKRILENYYYSINFSCTSFKLYSKRSDHLLQSKSNHCTIAECKVEDCISKATVQ